MPESRLADTKWLFKEYTEVWDLKVNKDKTKVMVFGVFQFDGTDVSKCHRIVTWD